ncbi:50S ribosomal protein L15 [Sorangium cellulosum]|jgi:large subunit ribosomal protein L15|uniref:Large ribosomal subunit protein uL15 n=1 Tax=Sorangium cellulosum TaxID=56 RepID=A0A4P2QB67_SORCE|nr:50S ribosomal protein L15 [Sorangium cellulosum]AUX26571.1 50S ribosomal protein L15 [Sorangium cellulosum]
MDILSKLQAPEGAVTKKLRVGRGVGSGVGKTAGRGQKGQKARAGGNINKKHFQGGQTPIQRRLPKRGFRNPLADVVVNVNVGALEAFDDGVAVDVTALQATRLVQGRFDVVKILGGGELTKKLTVTAHRFSKGAIEKIEKAGGKAVVLASPASREQSTDSASA